jgi:hypothetical protein
MSKIITFIGWIERKNNAMKTIFLILTVLVVNPALGCKCFFRSFAIEMKTADLIFRGTPLERTEQGELAVYKFAVTDVWKGEKTQTLEIKTPKKDGDCGMTFEIGSPYYVFATHGETTHCRPNLRTSEANLEAILKYAFDQKYRDNIGQNADASLNSFESEFFNDLLKEQRGGFDFRGKKVAFMDNEKIIDKQQYYKTWLSQEVFTDLVILEDDEKTQVGDFDVLLVSSDSEIMTGSRKKSVSRFVKLLAGK